MEVNIARGVGTRKFDCQISMLINFDGQIFDASTRVLKWNKKGLKNGTNMNKVYNMHNKYLSIIKLSFFVHWSTLHFLNLVGNGAQFSLENM